MSKNSKKSKKEKSVEKDLRRKLYHQTVSYHRLALGRGQHFIFGYIPWNSKGKIRKRPCSTNPNDFIHLGDCERPTTNYLHFRFNVLHGMLMCYPRADIAWFVKEYAPGNISIFTDRLEEQFSQIIRHLREEDGR